MNHTTIPTRYLVSACKVITATLDQLRALPEFPERSLGSARFELAGMFASTETPDAIAVGTAQMLSTVAKWMRIVPEEAGEPEFLGVIADRYEPWAPLEAYWTGDAASQILDLDEPNRSLQFASVLLALLETLESYYNNPDSIIAGIIDDLEFARMDLTRGLLQLLDESCTRNLVLDGALRHIPPAPDGRRQLAALAAHYDHAEHLLQEHTQLGYPEHP